MKPNPSIKRALGVLSLALALAGSAVAQTEAQPRLDTITLQAGMHNIRAEVARTPLQTQTGMMFRREMASHEGMLFVFDGLSRRCFWMKNTLLPLSIAFIADDGSVVNLAAVGSLALFFRAGALCAGDEPGLVRQARHQARVQAQGPALRLLGETSGRCALQAKLRWAKSQLTSAFMKVSTYFGRRLR
jgi:hypothetical protein